MHMSRSAESLATRQHSASSNESRVAGSGTSRSLSGHLSPATYTATADPLGACQELLQQVRTLHQINACVCSLVLPRSLGIPALWPGHTSSSDMIRGIRGWSRLLIILAVFKPSGQD